MKDRLSHRRRRSRKRSRRVSRRRRSRKRSRKRSRRVSRRRRSRKRSLKKYIRPKGKTGNEKKRFKKVLESARVALNSIKMPFHISDGTALGARRERNFIKNDHDIDLAVFKKDANTVSKANKIIKCMKKHGFRLKNRLGNLNIGFECQFEKDRVPLDIFWVDTEGIYKGKKVFVASSYFDLCDDLPNGVCVWGVSPYRVQSINFLGKKYFCLPKKTLVEKYGRDWKIPKSYSYSEGLEGEYKGMLKDYYK